MSTTIKKLICVLAVVALSGCSLFQTPQKVRVVSQSKPALEIPEATKPISGLKDVKFRVIVIDGVSSYVLDKKNYSNLATNNEIVQNKLHVQHEALKRYQEYYK